MPPQIPTSGVAGVVWPALPKPHEALVFAVLRQLDESQWWAPDILLAHQLRQFERVLGHALATVPFYAERLKFLRGKKAGELTPDLVRQIPILRRGDIQAAGEALTSRKVPEGHGAPFEIKTSGSTGSPVVTKGTMVTGTMLRACNLRYHFWFKRDFSAKTASIRMQRGAQVRASQANKALPWADGYASGPMVLRQVTTPISEQLAWLVEQDPDYLLTIPSNLMALIRLSKKQRVKLGKLREVATLGEAVDPALREICMKEWGVPVVDCYSSQELGLIAVQCPDNPNHHYHVMSESVFLEILNDKNEPCRPGEIGRMVLTSLHNFATPLIRYEIGDMAEPGEPCRCGRGLPVVTRILGRVRNILTLPSGEQIYPRFNFEDFIYELPIRQIQVVQENLEELAVRLVTERKLGPDEEETIRRSLLTTARHPFRLRFEYLPEIPRAASGKFEEFRSEVSV